MKKLMVALAAVALAMGAQAAAANWTVTAGNVFNGTGSTATENKVTGAAYVIDVASYTQAALFEAFVANPSMDIASIAAGTVNVKAGSISSTSGNTFSYGEGGNKYDFYFVVVGDDQIYFSNIKEQLTASTTSSATGIGFASQNNGSTTFSAALAGDTAAAGHWAAAVPEPTSGLLLLLGMAGLALKRKQA